MTEKIDWKQELLDSAKFNKKQREPIKKWCKVIN